MNNLSPEINQEITSDDKLLAMLSHISVFLGGIILPIIIWATQKDKSRFIRFHSLQAIFYQLAFAVIIMAFVFIMILIFIGSGIGMGIFNESEYAREKSMPVAMIVMLIIFYGGIFLAAFAGIGYAIYVAIKAFKGNLIKIPIIGKIIYKKVYG